MTTYKLEPIFEKIISSVSLVFPDGHKRIYQNGVEACSATFDKRYIISSLKAVDKNNIEVELVESDSTDSETFSSTASETSFF